MKKEFLIYKLSESVKTTSKIDNDLFVKYNVKRGLRNEDGSGVLVGLTQIGNVVGYERTPEGGLKAIPGKLFYRGYDVEDIVHDLIREKRFGFEEVAFLMLSGKLPDEDELQNFCELINENMPLEQKTKMNIIDLEGQNIMNILARSVLEMYNFDPNPDDTSPENLMRQSIQLISKFPTIIAYAYNILRHSTQGRSLNIRHPNENLSLAENFLYILKRNYTPLEARTLDLLLVLQAEHGGGNNSTFSVRVTSSTGTDTYSAIAAGIGSLKGPLHGGANIQVADMFLHLKENIADWKNTKEIDLYFQRMLNKEVYNKTGLIYGIGHAVYTISDPRALLLKELARDLAKEKGREEEFTFLELLEERAIEAFYRFKGSKKRVSSNIDFYSGFVYEMIGLPQEIYTPLFAMARIVGWTAHRIEELNFKSKRIIRPAYRNILDEQQYVSIKER
ncbi:MAG: citrate/2-methylcitrate synthase [Dysgonamonadaceae bacterium]|jgi:citrate synthase|nr:citrate/2-methylcitrate synthase [Dysgonamonadaceae bacterium]